MDLNGAFHFHTVILFTIMVTALATAQAKFLSELYILNTRTSFLTIVFNLV